MKNDITYEYRKTLKRPYLTVGHFEIGQCTYEVLTKQLKKPWNGRMYHTVDTNQFFFDWDGKRYELNWLGKSSNVDDAAIAALKKMIGNNTNGIKSLRDAIKNIKGVTPQQETLLKKLDTLAGDIEKAGQLVDDAKTAATEAKTVAEEVKGALDSKADKDAVAEKTHKHVLADIEDYVAPDLSTYATKDDLDKKSDKNHTHDEYQPKGDYATKDEIPTVPTVVSAFTNDAGYLTEHQDLSEYAKKSDIPEIPTDHLTKTVADETYQPKGEYLTEHQDLSDYAKKSDIPTVPTVVSAFTNDAGYLTEHQSLSDYAKTEYVDAETTRATEAEGALDTRVTALENEDDVIWSYSTETRKHIVLANHDSVVGAGTNCEVGQTNGYEGGQNLEGQNFNLVMMSKWNVADFGSKSVHMNLNSTDDIVTINDDKIVATRDEIPTVPTVVSAFTNDAEYITKTEADEMVSKIEIPSLDGYATQQYVDDEIAKINKDDIDLTSYIKRDELVEGTGITIAPATEAEGDTTKKISVSYGSLSTEATETEEAKEATAGAVEATELDEVIKALKAEIAALKAQTPDTPVVDENIITMYSNFEDIYTTMLYDVELEEQTINIPDGNGGYNGPRFTKFDDNATIFGKIFNYTSITKCGPSYLTFNVPNDYAVDIFTKDVRENNYEKWDSKSMIELSGGGLLNSKCNRITYTQKKISDNQFVVNTNFYVIIYKK